MSNSESPPKWKGYSKRQKWFMGGFVAVVIACMAATGVDKEWQDQQTLQHACMDLVSAAQGSWAQLGECTKLKP